MSRALRLAFFGTPDIASPYLHALAHAGHDLRAVVTQPDRPAGRGQALRPSPVKTVAAWMGLPVLQPASCDDPAFQAALRDSGADLGVVVAYGNLLPWEVLTAPSLGCVNLHYSLLPALRGAAPVQHALLAGLTETGVTVQWMSPELDAGDLIAAQAVAIDPEDDCAALFARLNDVGPGLLLEALGLIAEGRAPRVQQDPTGVTWAPELTGADCRIDWTEPAERICNRVRACSPRPGAYALRGGRRVKVLKTVAVPATESGQGGQPGGVAEIGFLGYPVVYSGCGAVALVTVQPEGRQPMSGEAYARGARFRPSELLS